LSEEKYLTASTRDWIQRFSSIKNLQDRIRGRKKGSFKTLDLYVKAVSYFANFAGYEDPDALINDVKEEKVDVLGLLDEFIDAKSHGRGSVTVLSYLSGLKKWLAVNGVDPKPIFADLDVPSVETVEEDRAPTLEELKTILHFCNIRDRAAVLVAATSGLRLGTLLSLKRKDVDFDSYPDIAKITVYRAMGRKLTKRHKFYITFMTPEARKAVKEYFDWRERLGQKVWDDPEAPLIGSVYRIYTREGLKETPGARTYGYGASFAHQWRNILKKAGLAEKGRKFYKLHFHTLRKWFETRCIDAGVKASYREFWMGHKGLYLDESYFRAEEAKHIEEYRKAICHLSIVEIPREDPRRERLIRRYIEKYAVSYEEAAKRVDEFLELEEERAIRAMDMEAAEEMARISLEQREKAKTDSEDCQRIVTEADLEGYLAEGWRIVAALPSGKIVIEKT